MFEKASRTKLRFQTAKGLLGTEDLWELNLQQLNTLAKAYNRQLKTTNEEDFLQEKSAEDVITQLQFDIVLHILNKKKAEQAARLDASAKKAEKEKILNILAKKQDNALENLSEEELTKKLESLV